MSAYLCDIEHIHFLVSAGLSSRRDRIHFLRGEDWTVLDESNDATNALVDILVHANAESLRHAYKSEADKADHEMVGDFRRYSSKTLTKHRRYLESPMTGRPERIAQVLKSISCYEYQACEHPDWIESAAKLYCDHLRSMWTRKLPGFEAAEWGAPKFEEPEPVRRPVRRVRSMKQARMFNA